MSGDRRRQCLQQDHQLLQKLAQASSILQLHTSGADPPDRYTLVFRGRGLTRDPSSRADVRVVDEHRVEIRIPYAYPQVAPDVRWLTPIFHPNVSFSGFIRLCDIGIQWDEPVSLDVVCERLWDVARLEYMNLENATNYQAKNWLQRQTDWQLPVDRRLLRDQSPRSMSNVARYRRTGSGRLEIQGGAESQDVLYIGEDTPMPPPPPPPRPRRPGRQADDGDVFYIGDE
jgi:hypothetical protein